MSTALVHYHFETRDALLAEALDYSYSHAGDARISSGELPAASHAERLQSMIEQCLPTTQALEQDWVLWVELWLRAARVPELRPVAEELYARLHAWFRDEIEAGVKDGEFARCDPDEVADRLLALLDGYGIRTLIGDGAMPLERARRARVERAGPRLGTGGDADGGSGRRAGAECRACGGAASPDRALHVAGDPVVGAGDVERRLVGAVERPDSGQVARRPARDVALRERIDAPRALEHRHREPGRLAVQRHEPVDHGARPGRLGRRQERRDSRSGGTSIDSTPGPCGHVEPNSHSLSASPFCPAACQNGAS